MRLSSVICMFGAALLLFAIARPHLGISSDVSPDLQLVLAEDVPSLQAAIDAGADISGGPDTLFPPLVHFINRKNDPCVELLLAKGADPEGFPTCHPLIFAVHTNNPRIARLLLERGANPNAANFHGQTALHMFATNADVDPQLFPMLIAAGANPHLTDRYGKTPLDLARAQGNDKAATCLLALDK